MREVPAGLLLTLCALLAGCHTTPTMPPGEGRGLVAFDPMPPAGAEVWNRPEVRVGDTYTLLHGGQTKVRFRVVDATAHGSTVVDDAGHRLRRDPDLGNLGEWPTEGEDPLHVFTPVDVRYHWPLWVGKKWRCEFADRTAAGQLLNIQATYVVEGMDTVVVPAGTFPALRIVRRTALIETGEQFLDRTMVLWYAPSIGYDVRQIQDSTTFELLDWTRGPAK
jgi:hypothetical protein